MCLLCDRLRTLSQRRSDRSTSGDLQLYLRPLLCRKSPDDRCTLVTGGVYGCKLGVSDQIIFPRHHH